MQQLSIFSLSSNAFLLFKLSFFKLLTSRCSNNRMNKTSSSPNNFSNKVNWTFQGQIKSYLLSLHFIFWCHFKTNQNKNGLWQKYWSYLNLLECLRLSCTDLFSLLYLWNNQLSVEQGYNLKKKIQLDNLKTTFSK